MKKTKSGGKIDFAPTLDKAKNMPGDMDLMNKKFSGGSKPKQGGVDKAKGEKVAPMKGNLHGTGKAKKPKAKK